mgnify:CR=1 FL=1
MGHVNTKVGKIAHVIRLTRYKLSTTSLAPVLWCLNWWSFGVSPSHTMLFMVPHNVRTSWPSEDNGRMKLDCKGLIIVVSVWGGGESMSRVHTDVLIEQCLDRCVLNRSLRSRSRKSSTYSKQTCKKWLLECSLLYQGNQHIKRGCETTWFLCWCRCHNFA